MVTYNSSAEYINRNSTATLEARLTSVRNVITALYTMAATASTTGNYKSYQLDDGQAIVKTEYTSIKDIEAGITAFERLEQRLLNQLNGRRIRLVDGKNFRQCY